jgi:hypothetical protein
VGERSESGTNKKLLVSLSATETRSCVRQIGTARAGRLVPAQNKSFDVGPQRKPRRKEENNTTGYLESGEWNRIVEALKPQVRELSREI